MLPHRVLLLALFLPGRPNGAARNPKLWEEPTLCVTQALRARRAHLSAANAWPKLILSRCSRGWKWPRCVTALSHQDRTKPVQTGVLEGREHRAGTLTQH